MSCFSFSKYTGCGNDFIMIDHRNPFLPLNVISHLCHRQNGIGADGVVLLEKSVSADLKMRIFNSDGSEAEMCGNGLRCLAMFAQELGFQKKALTIETMERRLTVDFHLTDVKAEMGAPHSIKQHISLEIEGKSLTSHYINTGVPHAVIFVDHLKEIDVVKLGRQIRNHPTFAPKGANVNFAEITGDGMLSMRTYERGVENETHACATGATAAAILAALTYPNKGFSANKPLAVLSFTEPLFIEFEIDQTGTIHRVSQTGPAKKTFSGTLDLKELT